MSRHGQSSSLADLHAAALVSHLCEMARCEPDELLPMMQCFLMAVRHYEFAPRWLCLICGRWHGAPITQRPPAECVCGSSVFKPEPAAGEGTDDE